MPERTLLGLDTSTSDVTAAVVRLADEGPVSLAQEVTSAATQHAERLAPNIEAALARARVLPRTLDGVVVGLGPGPFTGLRVGVATAAALADALGIPVYGVCSLDGIRRGCGDVLVATDARRREVYWATYTDGVRVHGPAVATPADLLVRLAGRRFGRLVLGGADAYRDLLTPLADEVVGAFPDGVGLVTAARDQGLLDRAPVALEPLYLRQPDAVASLGGPKSAVQPTSAELRVR